MAEQSVLHPGAGDYAWSLNEEDWLYSSFSELLNDDEGVEAGQVIFYGERQKKPAAYFMPSASEVLEIAGDRAYDVAGEFAEDFGRDVSPAARTELEEFLSTWAAKHLAVDFYEIVNVQRYTITAADLSDAATGRRDG